MSEAMGPAQFIGDTRRFVMVEVDRVNAALAEMREGPHMFDFKDRVQVIIRHNFDI